MAWNNAANIEQDFRNVFCKTNGRYEVTFSKTEAECYWQNYPMAGLDIQNEGLELNEVSAAFSWNYIANTKGTLRNVVCDQMKTGGNFLQLQ